MESVGEAMRDYSFYKGKGSSSQGTLDLKGAGYVESFLAWVLMLQDIA